MNTAKLIFNVQTLQALFAGPPYIADTDCNRQLELQQIHVNTANGLPIRKINIERFYMLFCSTLSKLYSFENK